MFPGGKSESRAVVQVLRHFGWTWVGIVSADDESSERSSMELQEAITQNGICIEFKLTLFHKILRWGSHFRGTLAHSSCRVVIFAGNFEDPNLLSTLIDIKNYRKVFIFPLNLPHYFHPLASFTLNGSLLLSLHKVEIPGLKDFLLSASPQKYPDVPFLESVWKDTFDCWLGVCNGSESFRTLEKSRYDAEDFRIAFQVYAAVHALAHALNDMYSHRSRDSTSQATWKMNYYLKNMQMMTLGGEEVTFDEEGNYLAKFDILNLVMWPNSTKETKTAGYYSQRGGASQIQIDDSAVMWNPAFTQFPVSVCSVSCLPGYHRNPKEGFHRCCYDCAPCPEGEITNATDMERCLKCPEYSWSNERRDTCVPRTIVFLSYGDTLGSCFVLAALFLCFLTCVVVGLFAKHKETAVVKANNRNVSMVLLLSLILSFLCPLLFIGLPTKESCLLRQVAMGVLCTISVSSVFSKTVTVVLAFRATRPGWTLRRCLGRHFSVSLLMVCSSGEVMICIFWLTISPPYLEYNTEVEIGKMIFQCNEASVTAFYAVIGYMGCLAVLSFIVAYLARKLPDAFNEAQYITFGMLVFCSVWISFIPAYLSTKGKYMVAVEVFSILASSAGLLGCIFIPKCYIILLRPELNIKSNLMTQEQVKQTLK
ncbi:vomeronasal type-2 receptor 26-like [Hyperolius riggenbachi]|uniref:vomeronasal type-2 receptor 26-like n=1 Tax=Hyperolius riggenbachi TaxID=752182 RepID=UPI0035A2B85F